MAADFLPEAYVHGVSHGCPPQAYGAEGPASHAPIAYTTTFTPNLVLSSR